MAIGMFRFGKKARDLVKELGVSYAMQYRWWNRWLHEGGTCEKEKKDLVDLARQRSELMPEFAGLQARKISICSTTCSQMDVCICNSMQRLNGLPQTYRRWNQVISTCS